MKAQGTHFAALDSGHVLAGRYRIEEALGQGASAAVYRAWDERLERVVAVKVLDPLRAADPVGRQRFEREYEILSRLSHPHIARSFCLSQDGELDLLVMEFIEGETLADRIVSGRLPYGEAIEIARDLTSALQACHQAGVLHRDLKPSNIALHPERGAVILDFGVAWFSTALNLTRTGASIGTPRYMAPELFSGALSDERADLYSLGVCLFEMVVGRPPYSTDNVIELVTRQGQSNAPRASAMVPGVPVALDEVLGRALALNPEERFATAGEMLTALRRGEVSAMAALRNSVPCAHCQTPRIITLSFCPGCGQAASWELEPGPLAVQLTELRDPQAVWSWLGARYPEALALTRPLLMARLKILPIPLVLGVSARSAEQLVAEAADVGACAEVVRARAFVGGARVRACPATEREIVAALWLHFGAFAALGCLLLALGMNGDVMLTFAGTGTMLVSLLGLGVARAYVRRPVLKRRPVSSEHKSQRSALTRRVRGQLAQLEHPRARRLAASVIARALPVFSERAERMPRAEREAIEGVLEEAMEAAAQVDIHARHILSRPRSRLAAELTSARRHLEGGEPGAQERVWALEGERDELVTASLAHDLSTRNLLEACERIMALTRDVGLIPPPRVLEAPRAQPEIAWRRFLPTLGEG